MAGEVLNHKQQIQKKTGYCNLIIDGKEVSKTRKVNVAWPSFELDFLDQFQIHVFTLPAKIELEVIIDEKIVDVVTLDIPGRHVKSLTSASRLIKEYEFSVRKNFIASLKQRGIDIEKEEVYMTEEEIKWFKTELPKIVNSQTEGIVFVKAEWEGFGHTLPPAKSETLFSSA